VPATFGLEKHAVDPLALIREHPEASYSYDEEADVLYLSFGPPRPARGVDVDGGAVVMVGEGNGQIVGITFIGLRRQVARELTEAEAEAGATR